MRITSTLFSTLLLATLLSACSVLQDTQSQLISHAFDKMLGKSAAEAKVFDNTLVENRMEDLLGDKYQHTVDLLNTAKTIEKEGPMYYAISQINPELKEQAGFVYNSDNNQMSVVTVKDNASKLAYEKVNAGKEKITPPLPKAFDSLMHPEKAVNQATEQARTQASDAVSHATGMNVEQMEALKNQANPDVLKQQAKEKSDQAIDKAIDKTLPSTSH